MRRVAAGLTLAIAIGAVEFSGPGSGEATAQTAARRAAALSMDAGSSRFTMSWVALDLPEGVVDKMTAEGTMDYVRRRGEVNYWQEHRIIYDGDVLYMRWPLPWRDEAPWIQSRVDSVDEHPFDLEERAMQNPIGLLEFLTSASRDTRIARTELVRGMATTQYEGTLDLQLVVDHAQADKREELQRWLDFIGEHEPTKVPFGLWVDNNGLTRRLRIDGPGVSVTIEYFDFGIPVGIMPPRESEILTDEQLWQELEAHTENEACRSGDGLWSVDRYTDSHAETWHNGGAGGHITTSESNTQTPRIRLCVDSSGSDGG